jgi:hypothetical protein
MQFTIKLTPFLHSSNPNRYSLDKEELKIQLDGAIEKIKIYDRSGIISQHRVYNDMFFTRQAHFGWCTEIG